MERGSDGYCRLVILGLVHHFQTELSLGTYLLVITTLINVGADYSGPHIVDHYNQLHGQRWQDSVDTHRY